MAQMFKPWFVVVTAAAILVVVDGLNYIQMGI